MGSSNEDLQMLDRYFRERVWLGKIYIRTGDTDITDCSEIAKDEGLADEQTSFKEDPWETCLVSG